MMILSEKERERVRRTSADYLQTENQVIHCHGPEKNLLKIFGKGKKNEDYL